MCVDKMNVHTQLAVLVLMAYYKICQFPKNLVKSHIGKKNNLIVFLRIFFLKNDLQIKIKKYNDFDYKIYIVKIHYSQRKNANIIQIICSAFILVVFEQNPPPLTWLPEQFRFETNVVSKPRRKHRSVFSPNTLQKLLFLSLYL